MNEAQIGMAVAAARRRTDRDEHRVGRGHRAGEIGREFEPAGARIVGDQVIEAGLVNRHLAARQSRDLRLVLVDANDLMAEIGKTGAGNKADIAGADHGNAHVGSIVKVANRLPVNAGPRLHSRRPSRSGERCLPDVHFLWPDILAD